MKPVEIDGRQYVIVPLDSLREAVAECEAGALTVPEVASAKDFAALLRDGTLPVTIRRACREGKLPAKQLGREWYVRAREAFGLAPTKGE